MRLHLVRHPKPIVAPDICYGATDLPVPAQENARVLRCLMTTLPTPTLLFSSPLRRCADLADSLSARCGWRPPIHDQRLAELDFGSWEMRTWEDIPRAEIDAWASDTLDYRPGGGESVTLMAARVSEFYGDLQRSHSGRQHDNDDVIVVCHAGTIRLLLACQHTLAPAEVAREAASTPHAIAYGEVVSLRC